MITGYKAVPALNDRHKILQHMKNINFDPITCGDRRMEAMIKKLLKGALQYSVGRRPESADVMMFQCYEILKRWNIRYARHAIKKFLIDRGLVKGPFSGHDQEIYIGQAG
jgi:hypothetical protein